MKKIINIKNIIFGLFIFFAIPVFSANPAQPFLPSDNIIDPGCTPLDSNCYVMLTSFTNEDVTGLDYSTTTGVLSLTSGYIIPTIASTTQWNSLVSDFSSSTRSLFSSDVVGLDYSDLTGVISLTSGYVIPTVASTTVWDEKVSSQWITDVDDIRYNTGKVFVGTYSIDQDGYFDGTTLYANNANKNLGSFFTDNSFSLDAENNSLTGLSLGSSSTPSLSFYNDADTGIWSPENNVLAVSTNGSERLRVLANGNVGIGTTSSLAPSFKLQVGNGTADTRTVSNPNNQYAFGAVNGSGGAFYMGAATNSATPDLVFSNSAGSEKLRITNSGNVGIGTASPSGAMLVVKNTNDSALFQYQGVNDNGNTNFLFTQNAGGDAVYNLYKNTSSIGSPDVQVSSYGNSWFNGGNVGIGTTTPTEKLTVEGNALFTGNLTIGPSSINSATGQGVFQNGYPAGALLVGADVNSIIRSSNTRKLASFTAPEYTNSRIVEFLNFDSTSSSIANLSLGGRVGGSQYAATSLNFVTAANTSTTGGTSRMYIDSSGNVGIGTVTPGGLFQVVSGSVNTAGDAVSQVSFIGPNVGFNNSGQGMLQIASNDAVAIDKGGSVVFGGRYTGTAQANWAGIQGAKENATNNNYAGYLSFGTRANGGPLAERMRITSAGNLGIGTSTPTNSLHVYKNANAEEGIMIENPNTGTSAAAAFYLKNNNGTIGGMNIGGSNFSSADFQDRTSVLSTKGLNIIANSNVSSGGTDDIRFFVGGYGSSNERMRITSTGNVGIGTTTPSSILHTVAPLPSSGNATYIQVGDSTFGGNIKIGVQRDAVTSYPAIWLNQSNPSLSNYAFLSVGSQSMFNAVDAIGFRISNSQKMILNAGGNLGIGTTTPSELLHLSASNLVVRQRLDQLNSSGYAEYQIKNGTSDFRFGTGGSGVASGFGAGGASYMLTVTGQPIQFGTANTEHMRITSAGNIGIGTTTPSEKLSVVGNVSINSATKSIIELKQDSAEIRFPYNSDIAYASNINFGDYSSIGSLRQGAGFYMGTGIKTINNTANSLSKTSGGQAHFFYTRYDRGLEFHTGISGSIGAVVADTEGLVGRFTPTGRFAIGANAASEPTAQVSMQTLATSIPTLQLKAIASQTGALLRWTDTSENVLGQILPSGNFLIGTATDITSFGGAKLQVRGTGSSTGNWRGRIVAGGDNATFLMGEYNNGAWLGAHNGNLSAWADLYIQGQGGKNVLIGYDGTTFSSTKLIASNIGIGTTTPSQKLSVIGNAQFTAVGSGAYAFDLNLTSDGTLTTSASDERLKENVLTISSTSTLDKINLLRPVTFDWKSNQSQDLGLIAQEVESVFPELVFVNKTDGFKGINYSRISTLLISAVQELSKKITSLFDGSAKIKVKELCIEDVCITKEQLTELLQNQNQSQNQNTTQNTTVTQTETVVTDDTVTENEGDNTDTVENESEPEPTPEPTPEPEPEPTPEPTPEVIPQDTNTESSTE